MTALPEPAGDAGPPAIDPFDPVALEARLAEARSRRARVLAGEGAPSPRISAIERLGRVASALRGAPGFVLGLGLGAGLATSLVLALMQPRGPVPATVTAPAPVKVAALVLPTSLLSPLPAAAAPGPQPRPADHAVAGAAVTRSARNAPAAPPPQVVVRRLAREVNAATVGRAAATLGVRERVTVPGLPLSIVLDRRGLRVIEHGGRGSKGRNRGHRD